MYYERIIITWAYGYTQAIHIDECARRHSELNPLHHIDSYAVHCTAGPACALERRAGWGPVAAVLAMSEPTHLALTLQDSAIKTLNIPIEKRTLEQVCRSRSGGARGESLTTMAPRCLAAGTAVRRGPSARLCAPVGAAPLEAGYW